MNVKEAEPTWRCWHASVHTACFLYSSQSQTSCFALATPKDRLWQVMTDASQYVSDRVRALTQEEDYVILVYMVRENKVILCDVQTGKLLLAEWIGAPKGKKRWEDKWYFNAFEFSRIAFTQETLHSLWKNLHTLAKILHFPRDIAFTCKLALRYSTPAPSQLILFPLQKFIGYKKVACWKWFSFLKTLFLSYRTLNKINWKKESIAKNYMMLKSQYNKIQ